MQIEHLIVTLRRFPITMITEVSGGKPADIISHLPADVINVILMCLPLRDAVRTSVLSRKWRYNWTKLSKLTLDHTLWKQTKKNISTPGIKFAVILYQLLSLHQGPITECKISIPELKRCPEIDNLLFFLSRNGIEHLVLELSKAKRYKLPSSVFTCPQMRHLTLQDCVINLPPTFKAFNKLLRLDLFDVVISDKSLEKLICCCPLLDMLVLDVSNTLNYIEVNAPQLRSFICRIKRNSIHFKNTPLLADVTMVMQHTEFYLPIFKSRIAGTEEIPMLLHLRYLRLFDIYLNLFHEVDGILRLIRSSPNLEEIEIEAFSDEEEELPVGEFLEAEYYSDINLNRLRKVKLKQIIGKRFEMELIKLLLAKSPMLETMLIEPRKKHITTGTLIHIMKQVTKFGRASPKAEVII